MRRSAVAAKRYAYVIAAVRGSAGSVLAGRLSAVPDAGVVALAVFSAIIACLAASQRLSCEATWKR